MGWRETTNASGDLAVVEMATLDILHRKIVDKERIIRWPLFFLQKVSALLHTSLHCCGRNWPKNKVWTSQVKKILSDGLNERFSGGLFGHGSYLAEEHGGVDG